MCQMEQVVKVAWRKATSPGWIFHGKILTRHSTASSMVADKPIGAVTINLVQLNVQSYLSGGANTHQSASKSHIGRFCRLCRANPVTHPMPRPLQKNPILHNVFQWDVHTPNVPFPVGDLGCVWYVVPWIHFSLYISVDIFVGSAVFCRAHGRDRDTDRWRYVKTSVAGPKN